MTTKNPQVAYTGRYRVQFPECRSSVEDIWSLIADRKTISGRLTKNSIVDNEGREVECAYATNGHFCLEIARVPAAAKLRVKLGPNGAYPIDLVKETYTRAQQDIFAGYLTEIATVQRTNKYKEVLNIVLLLDEGGRLFGINTVYYNWLEKNVKQMALRGGKDTHSAICVYSDFKPVGLIMPVRVDDFAVTPSYKKGKKS